MVKAAGAATRICYLITVMVPVYLVGVAPVRGQDGGRGKPPIALQRLDPGQSIVINGVVDDPAWSTIDPMPLVMYSPTYDGEMTEHTEIRVAYDTEYIYVSGILNDSAPASINANSFSRDGFSGDDQFAIVLDSYNDRETAVAFVLNPNGARSDRSIRADAQFTAGIPPFNSDWNAHWDGAAITDSTGWSAEIRVPFSSLGFQVVDGSATMGLSVYRSISRKNERHVFPNASPEYGFFAFGKPSLTQRVRFSGVERQPPILATPYVTGGMTTVPVLRGGDNPSWTTWNRETTEPGLDVRYSPSPGLSLDLTVNTDFAQVEADDQQINLTRFPLFFPEKRQFFQERSATFDFATGGVTDRVFFSRRIGLDGGELVRILGGVRAVGRIGGLDYGLLTMQTAANGTRSAENMSVFRVKQQVLNSNSRVGGIVTRRAGNNGEDNIAVGADADLRVFGDDYLTLTWAHTMDQRVREEDIFSSSLILAQLERRRQEGFAYSTQYRRVGDDYTPRLGFQSRTDFTLFTGEAAYSWFMGSESSLRTVSVTGATEHYFRNDDGTPESRLFNPQILAQFKTGAFTILQSRSVFESIPTAFAVAGVTIQPGEYWFHELDWGWRLSRGAALRGELGATAGTFFDGRRVSFTASPSFNITPHVEVRPSYTWNRFEFPEQGSVTAHLVALRLDYSLDTHLSFSTFAQYNSTTDQASVNARFRYHFKEGTDFWVVYNEGYLLDRDRLGSPRPPLSSGRGLLIKYSQTFTF